ncbi:aminoglycoside 3'-phosphotransferase [Agromyces salentinus]|uniref:Aminoglycoside 3'-phosphotransferase n=1 Tax=Agromyces salentinus TaxID=269421 RepID=A0ABN2MN44_9MICO|nr:aminoglycoside 3'-phosphotransferase [Agromyces salentinus]
MTPTDLAGPADGGTAVPEAIAAFAAGAAVTPVWRNVVGGLTFRIARGTHPGGAVFVKWNPAGSGESLADEERRLRWLQDRFPAPRVVASGADAAGEWLATGAIHALSAVSPAWVSRPDAAARAMGEGLRLLHESLDPAACPFDWSVPRRLEAARASGSPVPRSLHEPPAIDRLVVCHGDPCAPNTLIDDDGSFAAIVDVARLGTADRWADLAVASWSLEWNFGAGREQAFFDSYGVAPDPERIDYYRRLWDAT